MVGLALGGFKRRARLDRNGDDERKALRRWSRSSRKERSAADRLLADFSRTLAGDIDRVFDANAF